MGTACGTPNRNKKKSSKVHSVVIADAKIRSFYRIDPKPIGRGAFAIVRLGYPINGGSSLVAIKTISKKKLKVNTKYILRELSLFKEVDHPNIVKFYESFQDREYYHIVMEYCSGGEVMEALTRKGYFNEREVAFIMNKALNAVKYLHDKGIVHRDIKLRNLMYASKEKEAEIKLVDFSLARDVLQNETLQTQVGTPYYIAPEVLLGKYDKRCDIWSLGVMMYLLLSGDYPFDGKTTAILAKEILSSPIDLSGKLWDKISTNAKDLVQKLLEKDPNNRISLADACEHPWIKTGRRNSLINQEETTKIIQNLKNFSAKNKLKKEVLDVLVTMLDDKELKKLREAFNYFDKDHTGEITMADFKQVIKEQKLKVSDAEIEKIIKNVDLDESEKISFSEFLAAAMDHKFYQNREVLWSAFYHFDVENSGQISAKNIRDVLIRAGKRPTQLEIDAMINQIDKSKNGLIGFDEFCSLMQVEDYDKDIAEEIEKVNSMGKEVSVPNYRRNQSLFGMADHS